MIQSIDEIALQARQGSISAIIQILNEKLADSGVRTRAMLDGGVLQVLCEAATPEQLEQATLVERIRYLLEGIGPQKIRRVNINSRIVREQQLLWLDEIQRDPQGQLLWSQEICLKRLNPLKRWQENRKLNREAAMITPMPKTETRAKSASRHFWRGIIVGGSSLGLLLLLVGWAISDWLGYRMPEQFLKTANEVPTTPEPTASPMVSPAASPAASPVAATTTSSPDPFVEAVRLAEQTVNAGQTAKSSAEWLELASRWQKAADLMAQVPATDSRYATAQNRTQLYSQNSEAAQQRAAALRNSGAPQN